ncbi:hypothetical protein HMPREF2531_03484 [Bacteroides intestinalis]|uniref:Uncharacterized protein n=2 Tax=Bacteroides intestinalis TaxID=329854 RepID=A0A139L2G5_9BACE|nr:hypothetical protein HMPREF2531_03484 [Bacteroides intestinalis]
MLMEATLDNGQFRPGNEAQFMYTVFASEREMLGFYLSLNRFVSPVTYFVQRTDTERLNNLLHTLGKFQLFMGRFGTYQSLGIKTLIEGFGLYMMQQNISNRERKLAAEHVGYQMKFLMDMTKEIEQARSMSHILCSHIANVKYLIAKMQDQKQEVVNL